MTYAYRRSKDLFGRRTVELFISEDGRTPPAGYVACSWPRLVRAWRLRDALNFRAMPRPEAAPAKAGKR